MKSIRILIGLLFAMPLAASEIQPLESIRDAVREYVEANLDATQGETVVTVGQLDRRLRLKKCTQPLQAYLPSQAKLLGNTTVGVRCEGAKPWSLMVQVSIQRFMLVAVTAHPLGRNASVSLGDIQMKKVDISRLSGGYYDSAEAVKGMVMKRPVRAGTALTTAMLKPAILIKRGEKVIIHAKSGSIQVRMEGQALQNGVKGEVIEVENLSSKQVIEAVVLSPGLVQVRM